MAETTQTGRTEINVEDTPEAQKAMQGAWNNRNDKGSTSLSNDNKSDHSTSAADVINNAKNDSKDIQKKIDGLTADAIDSDTPVIPADTMNANTMNADTMNNEGTIDTTKKATGATITNKDKKDNNFFDSKFWDNILGRNKKEDDTKQDDKKEEVYVEDSKEGKKAIRRNYYENLHPENYKSPALQKIEAIPKDANAAARRQQEETNKNDTAAAEKLSASNLNYLQKVSKEPVTVREERDATTLPKMKNSEKPNVSNLKPEEKSKVIAQAFENQEKYAPVTDYIVNGKSHNAEAAEANKSRNEKNFYQSFFKK